MSTRRHLLAAAAALCLTVPLLAGAVAEAQAPPRHHADRVPKDYPRLGPSGTWHWYPTDEYAGGFKLKVPKDKSKPPTISKISFTSLKYGTANCPGPGTTFTVTGKVTLKPAPKRNDIYGYSPWDTGKVKGNKRGLGELDNFEGVKPVPVKVSVNGAAPVDGNVAFEFVKPQENKKYYGVVNVIQYGSCYLHVSFSYPDK